MKRYTDIDRKYKRLKNEIKDQTRWFTTLPDSLKIEFIETVFRMIDEKRKREILLNKLGNLVYPDWKWKKIEYWMEKRFKKDMTRTPRQVAGMCLNYFRISTKMAPFIIKLAQKVKDRLRKRYNKEQKRRSS